MGGPPGRAGLLDGGMEGRPGGGASLREVGGVFSETFLSSALLKNQIETKCVFCCSMSYYHVKTLLCVVVLTSRLELVRASFVQHEVSFS